MNNVSKILHIYFYKNPQSLPKVSEQGSTLFSDVPTQQFYIFYGKIKYFIKGVV